MEEREGEEEKKGVAGLDNQRNKPQATGCSDPLSDRCNSKQDTLGMPHEVISSLISS